MFGFCRSPGAHANVFLCFFALSSAIPSQCSTAQTVQLPTLHTFSLSGSVLVPDQGSASLGGVQRSAQSYTSRGWPRSKTFSSQASSSGVTVSATIIDLDELDRQIRNETTPNPRFDIGVSRRRGSMDPVLGPVPASSSKDSLAVDEALKARHALDRVDRGLQRPQPKNSYDYLATLSHTSQNLPDKPTAIEDASYYLDQAERAESRGHWSAVEVYYQLAWKSLPEDRKQRILKKLGRCGVSLHLSRRD